MRGVLDVQFTKMLRKRHENTDGNQQIPGSTVSQVQGYSIHKEGFCGKASTAG